MNSLLARSLIRRQGPPFRRYSVDRIARFFEKYRLVLVLNVVLVVLNITRHIVLAFARITNLSHFLLCNMFDRLGRVTPDTCYDLRR